MLSTRMSYFLRATLLAAALLAGGCQTAPVQEMSDARQAISVAREAGAETNAETELDAAIDYLQKAERFLNERNYDLARRAALSAKSSALEALRRAEAGTDSEAK